MHHQSRFTKTLRNGGEHLGEWANRTIGRRNSTSLLFPALLIAGSVAGVVIAYYLRARNRSRASESDRMAGADDIREPIVVEGGESISSPGIVQDAEDRVPERSEYFAADTSSTPAPGSPSTDNADIPTLYPEDDRRESEPPLQSRQR